MQAKLTATMTDFGRLLQKAGPYVVLEIVLPGGTLFALLLYLYRTGQLRDLAGVRMLGRTVLGTAGRVFDSLAFTMQPLAVTPVGSTSARDGLEPLDFFSGRK